jgi:hypothetical protein
MSDPAQTLKELLEAAALGKPSLYPSNSRYHGIGTATLTTASGKQITYLRRRFVPAGSDLELLQEHTVTGGERLDQIAARYFDDAEQFWRICDANDAIRPDDLVKTEGRRLRISVPAAGQV